MEKVKKVTLSGMLFAIGLILPLFIGQIPAVGKMLLPMHIPVLICGLILGWQYGLAVGFLLPLVRSVLFGMPVLYIRSRGRLAVWSRKVAVHENTVPFSCRSYDFRPCGMGVCRSDSAWHDRHDVYMGNVSCRCVFKCYPGHYPAACADSGADGGTEKGKGCAVP